MDSVEQRIRIATACGWIRCYWDCPHEVCMGIRPGGKGIFEELPHYTTDLKAMYYIEIL